MDDRLEAFNSLLEMIEARKARLAVVGLGYVGLPLASTFHATGFHVVGFDVDEDKVRHLEVGTSYLGQEYDETIQTLAQSDRFRASADPATLGNADVVFVCVPTPLGPHREPDLSYVVATAANLGANKRVPQLVILESTTYPGTTRREFKQAFDAKLNVGQGASLFVGYSPEREDPGRVDLSTAAIPKLVGGLDDQSTRLTEAIYGQAFDEIVPVSSVEVAEASKLFENIFRAVNIALVNELKVALTDLDIDVWEVIDAAATKPFGFMRFEPGPGLGGHCIPIDPFYLTWRAREVGRDLGFIEHAGVINTQMPRYVVQRLMEALNDRGKALSRCRILVLGLAYKPDVADDRESPSYELMDLMTERSAHVDYHDSRIPKTRPGRAGHAERLSVQLTKESIGAYDAIVISTPHSDVDYSLIAEEAQLVIDTRNAMSEFRSGMDDRIVLS